MLILALKKNIWESLGVVVLIWAPQKKIWESLGVVNTNFSAEKINLGVVVIRAEFGSRQAKNNTIFFFLGVVDKIQPPLTTIKLKTHVNVLKIHHFFSGTGS